ncbi:MAG: dihydropteroate synthase [Candidatus Omnitrophica bacterium]|nr:dihydropteroate synthase [Candidatus Omnitrophota bacterium]MDD5671982.1 dihydropteroate synthase [Candidatus Omnitrophota bacterium]
MGILNITPDSFSDGGQFFEPSHAVDHAFEMIREGADILDIGGESSRPGAKPVSSDTELSRILPVVKMIRERSTVPISIDTTKADVAKACLGAGADMINDVSGLRDSGKEMAEAAHSFGAGLILMHRRGTPETMQSCADYQDVVGETVEELRASIQLALDYGIKHDRLAIDPGLGFAKDTRHNLEVLNRLEAFHRLGYPVLLGPSRKSFIGEITGKAVEDRDFGTAAVVAVAVLKGVQILRVHNVAAMRDVIQTTLKICGDRYVRTL